MQKFYVCLAVLVSLYSVHAENLATIQKIAPGQIGMRESGLARIGGEAAERRGNRWMAIGLASFAAGQTLDIASSWHKRELNGFLGSPLPDGRCCIFDGRGLAIKAGAAGALGLSFWLAGKAMPAHRAKFGKALALMGVGSAALSFHNFTQPIAQ